MEEVLLLGLKDREVNFQETKQINYLFISFYLGLYIILE